MELLWGTPCARKAEWNGIVPWCGSASTEDHDLRPSGKRAPTRPSMKRTTKGDGGRQQDDGREV